MIQAMANKGVSFNKKPGDFIDFVRRIYVLAMGDEIAVGESENYRLTECLSTGRPRIFPPGAMPIGGDDIVSFEFTTEDGTHMRKLRLNNILANILEEKPNYKKDRDIGNGKIQDLMNVWISNYAKNKREGRELNKDQYVIVTFFLGKKVNNILQENQEGLYSLDNYLIDNQRIQDILKNILLKEKGK